MTTILAAIDDSEAASAVLAIAAAFADVTAATPAALHVRENGGEHARATAEATGIPLREATGDVIDQITIAATAPDVRAVVVGARRHPEGARPAGHVAFALLTCLATPLVVVPPDARSPITLRRMLVPLDGTMTTARRARAAIDLATTGGLDVILIHVCDEDHIPMFTDQPQHETNSFAEEFIARYAPQAAVRLELRVGPTADEVLAAAADLHADLLAIAWAQILQPGRARVVKELLARSRVPLLLLPLGRAEPTPT